MKQISNIINLSLFRKFFALLAGRIGQRANIYFFRDSNGQEVDLIIDRGMRQVPIEIKSSGTFNKDFLKGITYWQKLTEQSKETTKERGFVIYTGTQPHKGKDYSLLQWNDLDQIFAQVS